jgi:hypothetical protein
MPWLPSTYPTNRVHSEGGGDNLDYYIIKVLLGAIIRCRHVWIPMRRSSSFRWQGLRLRPSDPPPSQRHAASGFNPPIASVHELCSGTSGFSTFLETCKIVPSEWAKASWTPSACFGLNLRVTLLVPFVRCWRLTANSSPSNVRLNPDDPNLRSLGEFCAESVTPVSWGWNFACAFDACSKKSSSDDAEQLCMVILFASARSITTHNCAMTSLASLLELWGSFLLSCCGSLWIADVVLKFLPCSHLNKKCHPHLRSSGWWRLCVIPRFRKKWTEASIRVPKMFKSHAWPTIMIKQLKCYAYSIFRVCLLQKDPWVKKNIK